MNKISKILTSALFVSSLAIAQSTGTQVAQAVAPNTSVCFAGSQYLSNSVMTNLPVNMEAYTIEAWIKTNNNSRQSIAGWGAAAGNQANSFTAETNGGLYNWWYGNDIINVPSGSDLFNNSWHHVVAQFDGTTRSLYKDGVRIATNTPTGHVVTNTGSFRIGGFNNEWFRGCISNLRIVKALAVYSGDSFTVPTAALTAIQSSSTNIAAIPSGATVLLMNNPSNILLDNSSYGYTLTNNGATLSTDGPSISYGAVTSTALTDTIALRVSGTIDTLTATISSGGSVAAAATGTVSFANNGTPISGCGTVNIVSGIANCAFTVPAGSASITATYSGNTDYGTSTSSALTFVVPLVARDASSACELSLTGSNLTNFAVTKSGIYCLATFKDVGSYTITVPSTTNAVDYLVVAGGGGGASGGGGAGGLLQGSNYAVTPSSSISVTVGGGGAGGNGGSAQTGVAGEKGGDSIFASITAIGGGGGNSGGKTVTTGGSGGGSSYDCTSTGGPCGLPGAGTVGQGNKGGFSTYNSYGGGAGGGGAGGAGYNTTRNYIGGNGGIGATSSLINELAAATGTGVLSSGNYYFAGGGGGGINDNTNQYVGLNASGVLLLGGNSGAAAAGTVYTNGGGKGGTGGGGRGSSFGRAGGTAGQYTNPTAGTANTGGGGGGTDPEDINAGAGGSGVVIIRWVASTSLKTITFNSNDGLATTTTQKVTSGITTQLNPGTFTRSGYIFSGWTTNADGSGTSYTDSSNISITADTNLYAKWITGVNKTVTFNGNTSTSGTMTAQSAGTATALTTNAFVKTGYTFTGWNTLANGTGYSYVENAVYAFTTDTTLYAQWQANRTFYTVTFYANAVDATGTTASQTSDVAAALNLSGFTRPNKNFLGWDTNYASGTATYKDGETYAFTSNIDLYAIWVNQVSRDVTFNGNGSTSGSTASQTASSSTTLNPNGFAKTGYTFLKWNTAVDGTGVSYNSGYTYSFAAGLILYAVWSKNLTISYSGNDSTSGSVPTSQAYYVGGPKLTVATNTGNLQKTGYTLVGWNTAANGTGTAYAIGGTNSTFTNDATLYAQWAGATFAILYTGNGSTSGSVPSSQSYTFGSTGITLRSNTSPLARTGYEFTGWNSQPDGSGTAYAEGATPVTFDGDTVLFAQWTPISYVITYNANTGTVSAPSATFSFGGSITLLTPTKTGHAFLGWYDTLTAGTKIADGGVSYNTSGSRTLYAHWLINSYTYTYNGNGGTVDTSTVTYNFGDPAITLRSPSRANYQFDGWYTLASAGTRIGGAGDSNTPTVSQTLYAHWTQLSLVGMGSATNIGSITTSRDIGNSYTASSGGTRVTIDYPANALPDGTVIDIYLLADTTRAAGLISDASNLLLSLVVAWKATDGTVPSAASGNPLTMTIRNAEIKAGAKIYCLIGNVVTLLGTATVDGAATATFADDPEIVIANPVVTPPSSGGSGGGGSGGGYTAPTPTAAELAATAKAAADAKLAAEQKAAAEAAAAKALDDAKLAAEQKAAADAATKLAADQLAATQKAAADAATKLAADQLAATQKAAADALAAAIAAAPKSINKPISSIATAVTSMLLPVDIQNAVIQLTKALVKLGASTKAKLVTLPTSKLLISKATVRTPGICSVSGTTVKSKSLGTCVLTYTMTTSTGQTVRTMKKITFKK